MAEEAPMMGAEPQPLAIGRFFQSEDSAVLPMLGGGFGEVGNLYLVGIFPSSELPVICGGPYRSEVEIEKALRAIVLQPPPIPRHRHE